MDEIKPQAPLSYLRNNVAIPGDNFVQQWGTLTPKDKTDLQTWAIEEMGVLGIPVK
jgi:hypothetical protein